MIDVGNELGLNDQELRELKGQMAAAALKLEHDVRQSKGPGTAKGKILDYSEWHPIEIGGGLTFLAFTIHPAFFAIYFGLMAKAIIDTYVRKKEPRGLIKQIGHELHYYIMAAVGVVAFMQALGYSVPDVAIRSVDLVRIILGA